MSVNNLTFNQLATVLNSIVHQATGAATLTPTNTAEFVSVGTTGIAGGLDPMFNALTQMLGRTIFANRRYSRRFKGIEVDGQRWGYITRKISVADRDFDNDPSFTLTDGGTVDPWIIKKAKVIEEKFYGQNVWDDQLTVPVVQLRSAFTNPADFAALLDLLTTNMQDRMEQAVENGARAALANYIGGIVAGGSSLENGRLIHLLTEYNTETGLTLTNITVNQPANFASFMRWAYARIAMVSDAMRERTGLFHTQLTNMPIMRHTPAEDQRLFVFSPNRHKMDSTVLSTTFNDQYLQQPYTESVNFWQAIDTPDTIEVFPSYLTASGTITEVPSSGTAITQDKIFAVLCDRDALGVTRFDESMLNSPLNPRGQYYNVFYHQIVRWWNSFTENFVVFLLD